MENKLSSFKKDIEEDIGADELRKDVFNELRMEELEKTKKSNLPTRNSATSPPRGNEVDGSPPAVVCEALPFRLLLAERRLKLC